MVTLTHLHVCCGGFNTRAGSIIIGVLCVVSGVFVILGNWLTLTAYRPTGRQLTPEESLQLYYQRQNRVVGAFGPTATFQFIPIAQIIIGVIEIVISGLLVWGAVKKRAKLVYPWIIVNIIQTSLVTICLISLIIYFLVAGSLEVAFALSVLEVVYFVFHAYLILVITSFHTTLVSGPEPVQGHEMGNAYHQHKDLDMA